MKKSLAISFLLVIVSSCNVDDYLESENDLASRLFGEPQNLEAIEATLFGTYWQMAIGRSESGFTQPIPIYADWNITASDAYTITDEPTNLYALNRDNSYWFYNRVLDHFEDRSVENLYSICYTLISNLNSAIAVIEEPTVELIADITANEAVYNQYVGEIYGLRALNYFMLSQLYGPKYRPNEANDMASLIIKTRISSQFEDIFDTRSTVQEVYDFMISDLMIAADHISSTKNVGRLNKGAIYALLARIHLDMNDWANVREYAGLAIAEGFDLEDNPIDEFNHTDNSTSIGVIFELQNSIGHNWEGQRHIEFVSENSPVRFSRWNWIERRTMGRRDILGQTYTVDNVGIRTYAISHSVMREIGWMEQSTDDLTSAALNDLRVQQVYHWAEGGTDSRMAPPIVADIPSENFLWVFKDARSADDNVMDGNDFTFELYEGRAHLPVIRVAEMYLTRAIANFRLNDEGAARADLNYVKEKRWDTSAGPFVPFSGGGPSLELEIKNERARELFGEGDRLFYLKAMQYDIPIGDAERRPEISQPIVTYPYDGLTWELPPNELDNNPRIDDQ